jgi:UDP-2-acetamido-3-amino-2,3-dideoxy-glucuronate N-acetyltransferase
MDERTPRVAVLGSGGWGRNHVRTWFELGALAVVCDPSQERLDAVAPQIPGVELSTDPTAPTHAELAIAAMEHGKDVLVEKPLAVDVASARTIVDVAERLDAVLMVGHVLEYHPAVLALHDLLAKGELGELRWLYSNRLNLGRVRTAEDVLWSFSPHDIAMLLRLGGGDPTTITARGGAYLSDDIADTAFLGMTFPGGVQAQIFASWLHPFKEQRLVVVGSEAMAVFDDLAPHGSKLVVTPYRVDWSDPVAPMTDKGEPRAIDIPPTPPLTAECEHFLARIADRARPLTDGPSGLRVLHVLDTAHRSMQAGGAPVAFDLAGSAS